MDLRVRVAKAKGTGTSGEVAARFDVNDSWVRRLWLRFAATGSGRSAAAGRESWSQGRCGG